MNTSRAWTVIVLTVIAGSRAWSQEAFPEPCISPSRHEAAKVRILRLIQRLKEALGPVAPTVKYGNTLLVSDGKPAYRIVCPAGEDPTRYSRIHRCYIPDTHGGRSLTVLLD